MSPAEALALLDAAAPLFPKRDGRVLVDLSGPVAVLTIDNPAAKNAITGAMMLQLHHAVEQVLTWDGAAVVVTGTPCGAFCSGGHLGDVRAGLTRPGLGQAMTVVVGDALDRLLAAPLISVAAIDGVAVGGGAELSTATDFRVATPDSRIHFVHARLGVAPGWGGARRLVQHIGRRKALRVLSTAEPIAAPQAVELGLMDRIGSGSALSVAQAFLAPVLALPAASVRAVKTQVVAGDRDAETAAFLNLWGGAAHRDALND